MNKVDLQAAIAKTAGSTRRAPPEAARSGRAEGQPTEGGQPYRQPSRQGTKPITGHFPKEVRDALKRLAIERDTTLQNLMAEAFNDLLAKHGKPEIAPLDRKR
jgi:hypothetical protein